jgi:hypothetical protein
MKMQRVTSPHVTEAAPGTWSNCRVYGNQFFVAGMTAGDGKGGVLGDGSMYSQAKETFTKIKHLYLGGGPPLTRGGERRVPTIVSVNPALYPSYAQKEESAGWEAGRSFEAMRPGRAGSISEILV